MTLFDTLSKVAGTLLAIAKNRAELASIELQEELGRIIGYIAFAVAAFFCIFVGIVMAGILPCWRPRWYLRLFPCHWPYPCPEGAQQYQK